MNTHALIQGIDDFSPFASEKSYLFSWLQIMRAWSVDMAVAVAKSIDAKEGGAVTNYLKSIVGEVRSIKARALFSSIEETSVGLRALGKAVGESGEEGGAAQRAQRYLDHFSECYESFIESPTPRSVYMLVLSSDMLRNAIVTLEGLLSGIRNQVVEQSVEEGEQRLVIHLRAPVAFADFGTKLTALQVAFDELGRAVIGGDLAPLRVSRIESGPFSVSLVGPANIIAILEDAIARAALWVYKNHPDDDPSLAIETLTPDEARMHLDVTRYLPEGLDSATIDRVSARAMKGLATLVKGQPDLEVNGKKYSVGDVSRQRFLVG